MTGRGVAYVDGRRIAATVAAVAAVAALGGCGGSDGDETRGCRGTANGGTVVVQGSSASLVDGISAGVGSIDVDRDKATAILTLTERNDLAKVRSVPVTVGTTFPAGNQQLAVTQICRGSVTVDAAG